MVVSGDGYSYIKCSTPFKMQEEGGEAHARLRKMQKLQLAANNILAFQFTQFGSIFKRILLFLCHSKVGYLLLTSL